jgi:hypothetical protein
VALGRFSPSTSVSPANLQSIKFSIIIITRGRYNRPFSARRAEWTHLDSTPPPSTVRIKKTALALYSEGIQFEPLCDTGYPDWGFRWFRHFFQACARIEILLGHDHFFPNTFQHYSFHRLPIRRQIISILTASLSSKLNTVQDLMSVASCLLWLRDFYFFCSTSYASTDDNVMVILTAVADMCLGFLQGNGTANESVRHFTEKFPTRRMGPTWCKNVLRA